MSVRITPKVYSKRKSAPAEYGNPPANAVLVDRTTDYGNPFRIGKHGDRTMVLKLFADYASKRFADEPEWLDPLVGKDLICWCAPDDCHADILLRLAHHRNVQLTILEVVSDHWMTIPELTCQVAEKLGTAPNELRVLVAYYTGLFSCGRGIETKAVLCEGTEGNYYYLCRKHP